MPITSCQLMEDANKAKPVMRTARRLRSDLSFARRTRFFQCTRLRLAVTGDCAQERLLGFENGDLLGRTHQHQAHPHQRGGYGEDGGYGEVGGNL